MSDASAHTTPFAFVIVGAGHAGVELAFALRKEAAQGRILLVDAGDALPYHRPPLSKQYLLAQEEAQTTLLRPAQAYAEHGIELRLGTRVTGLDRQRRRIHMDGADSVEYGTLILATGARARQLELPLPDGPLAPGVLHTLRTADDARKLRGALRAGSSIAIIGAGYIGLEVAAAAASSGIDSHVIERQEQLLARSASAELARFLQTAHASNGVRFHLGSTLRTARPGRNGAGVLLELDTAQGPRDVQADLLLAGIGATPNTALAEAVGLAAVNGILVDEDARTEDPAIYAIGDCAACRPASGTLPVRPESIPAALAQAQGLAARLCGKPAPGAAAPWFWSDQYGMKIQIAGTRDHDEVLVRRTEDPPSLSLFYVSNGRLAGMESVNNPKGFLQARRLIGQGAPMDAALLS